MISAHGFILEFKGEKVFVVLLTLVFSLNTHAITISFRTNWRRIGAQSSKAALWREIAPGDHEEQIRGWSHGGFIFNEPFSVR